MSINNISFINPITNASYFYSLDFNNTYQKTKTVSTQGIYCLSKNGKSCFYDNG
jgi:hypothetical protein